MKQNRKLMTVGVIVLGLVTVVSLARYSQATKLARKNKNNALKDAVSSGAAGAAPAAVEASLFLVEKKPFTDSIPGLVGTIKGNTIEMTFNGQEERLIAVHADVGQRVQTGQVLFELDHTRTAARKSQAESALIRAQELLAAGGATPYDLNDAQAAFELANKDYQDTFIYAYTGGSVSQVNKQVGETVGRSDVIAVLVASEGRLVLETGVVESQLSEVKEGQKALIEVDAFFKKKIEGRVVGVSREVTTTGRTGLVLVGIPVEVQKNLRPGLSARCEILTYNVPTLVIPRQAYDNEKKSVTVVGQDGKGRHVPIVLGHITRDYYEVVKGLKEGDTIVADVVTNPVEDGTLLAASGDIQHFKPEPVDN